MTEQSLLTIAALAPGFIGIAVSKLLNGDPRPEPLNSGVLKYFLYASASIIIADLLPFAQPLRRALANQPLSYADYITPIVISILLSAFWTLCGLRLAINAGNYLNRTAGRNEVFLREDLSELMFNDNKAHFLQIDCPDGRSYNGYLSNVISGEGIILEPEPDWCKNFTRKYTRIMISNDGKYVIREYEFINPENGKQ